MVLCSRSRPDSNTILVSSSTNSGTPSVLATICCTTPRQCLALRDPLHHLLDLRARQARQGELGSDRSGGSTAGRTRATCQQVHSEAVGVWSRKPGPAAPGSRDRPRQVFPYCQHRLALRLCDQPGDQGFLGLLFVLGDSTPAVGSAASGTLSRAAMSGTASSRGRRVQSRSPACRGAPRRARRAEIAGRLEMGNHWIEGTLLVW